MTSPEYTKARELAQLILNSDYKKNLDDALHAYENNPTAKQTFETYKQAKADYHQRLRRKDHLTQNLCAERAELDTLEQAIATNTDILHLQAVEEEYNDYVNKIMQLLKATIQDGKECGAHSGCGGCSTGA